MSTARRARGAGGGSAVAPQPGPRSPRPPQHGRGPSPAEVAASHPLCARLTPALLTLPASVPVPQRLPRVAPERPPVLALWPLRGCRQAGVAFQVVCGLSIMAGCFPAPLGRIWALPALGDQGFSFGCRLLCEGPGLCVPGLLFEPLECVSAGLAPSLALRPLMGEQTSLSKEEGGKESPARFQRASQVTTCSLKCFPPS